MGFLLQSSEHGLHQKVDPDEFARNIRQFADARQFRIPFKNLVEVEGNNVMEDTEHGFLANMNEQVQKVCGQLKADPKLANGYNAIGFSQGGLFVFGTNVFFKSITISFQTCSGSTLS